MLDFTRLELQRHNNVEFAEGLEFSAEIFDNDSRINGLKDVEVKGRGYYQEDLDLFAVNAEIKGTMLVPCAVTLVELEYPFTAEMAVTYTFQAKSDDNQIQVKKKLVDLKPEIFQTIMLEVPLKVTADNINYKKGENWEVIKESDYQTEVEKQRDPRLLKLKDFKFEDEEE